MPTSRPEFKDEQLWLGSQQSFNMSLHAAIKASEKPEFASDSGYEDVVVEQLLNVQDGVAMIHIKGSLVSGSAGYGLFYGAVGYDDLRCALSAAVSNPNVSAILLNVDSGGGAVAGVHELSQVISRVNAIKPVVTYAGGVMGSAATWLGRAASYVYCAETSITGSIGIIMVHMERSKMLEEMGVKVTVIRAGAEKALATPYEPLPDKARENFQRQADGLYKIFIGAMADYCQVSYEVADEKFGQGREFLGKEAVSAGLIDKVGTLEDAFAKCMKLGTSKKAETQRGTSASMTTNSKVVQARASTAQACLADNQPTSEGTPMPKPLTPEILAAMAAGVDLTDTTVADQTTATAGTEAKTDADVLVTEPAAAATVDALTVLQGMLATATTAAATAEAKAGQLQKDFDALTAQASAFTEIARASVKTMGLHFGVKSEAVAAMSPAEVLSEHTRLSELFKAKFKVGSVAATTQVDEPETKAQVSPLFAAALLSTKAR